MTLSIGACGIAVGACVNPSGNGGCYTTIGAAVAAASAHDTITVAPGTYHEDVVISTPLSLIGAGASNTIIDSTGLPNGIHVDGFEHAGLNHVTVTGFTVKNADFQGILVTDASFVNIADNRVTGNDTHLLPFDTPIPTCPGLETFLGGILTVSRT
jgi:pectin methylesterase-like acyl-CoA thioesterase